MEQAIIVPWMDFHKSLPAGLPIFLLALPSPILTQQPRWCYWNLDLIMWLPWLKSSKGRASDCEYKPKLFKWPSKSHSLDPLISLTSSPVMHPQTHQVLYWLREFSLLLEWLPLNISSLSSFKSAQMPPSPWQFPHGRGNFLENYHP